MDFMYGMEEEGFAFVIIDPIEEERDGWKGMCEYIALGVDIAMAIYVDEDGVLDGVTDGAMYAAIG